MGYDSHLWLLWDGHKIVCSKNIIFDKSCYFIPDLPSEQLTSSRITSDQGQAEILGIEDSSAEILYISDKEKINNVPNIATPQNHFISSNLGPSYSSLTLSDDVSIPDS